MEILDCPLETPYAFDMGRKCCEVRERLSVIVFTGMRFKKLKPEWNPELDPDRTQVRIGSDPTNKRLLESILSVADKLLADQLCQGDVNFENSKLYVDTWFASYVYFIPLIKFETTNNSRDFKCTNIKVFSKFTIISCWRPKPWREKNPPKVVGFTKLKAI